ncbi:phosphoribosyl-ATP pyrophosphatase [Clostridium pasteurianum DSM 525 = ATCC 6013]|uniref:Phosphoribosyl-ATP pyrophosphatase n=2 Tax=Clostridium pasteurianum TaxID=1501 RepID=A0A0H3J7Z0_CLOPA|nr:phosphoribosyl-ATP pyrophosphatase [Clostridium pasteurianum DSM 525 = ATCC 6013]AOZ80300.1 phosphoribosyl-ATP pyrophosphatase [Clostridium pasteurianum]AJA53315.1 phosphoribosyl-ATP pyrophosphatase [Clostridium pasteurianum DSM 525 = ATCC 6013]AOZ76503.1 phosphoribosyl-ATP pyrophosphatase [Clostridium pasteurianum DSM 525 = ATCC 6013]ELP58347.1 phosphoribosyl-ATP pyrophosphatase [Clostridium pasteurianum DSM 525 = ATCC 6013]
MNEIIKELYATILDRKANPIKDSYTNYLFEKGVDKILKKVGEECTETVIAAKNNDPKELVMETCDLVYHLLVLLANQGIDLKDVEAELIKREAKTGNKKPERREIENL